MIVAGMLVSFALVDVDDCGVSELLAELLLVPEGLKEVGDLEKKDRAASLVHVGRDCIQSSGFPSEHLLDGFQHLFSRWGRVKFQVHRSLWKALNGCVIDCRGAVEDTVKVFSPSL